ncbi:Rhodanese-like domain-containing protein [Neurospora hispaniola]|uniref:Rhodanese-like domain-containing protein n=1 Tax=Neurospora hispaniola TaxID=588809 RepID=A0AAJ0HZV7_9PEZI|nr:Rhodanese-like domain-containing protein [Neurospora hispaniola]
MLSAPTRRSIARLSAGAAKSIGSTGTTSVAGSVTNATLGKAAAATKGQQQVIPTKRAFSTAVRPNNTSTATRAARAAYYSQEAQGKGQKAGENKIWAFEEIQTLIEDPNRNVIIIDTREPGELHQTGRIPTAINIPITTSPDSFFISEDEFEDRFGFPRPSKDSEVVFYCKAGVRSRGAAGLAREAGWEKVGEYPGSWLDWAARGGKVER